MRASAVLALMLCASVSDAQEKKPFDAAIAFGARPSVTDVSLSPDGSSIAFISSAPGLGANIVTVDLTAGAKPQAALYASGKPERLEECRWVSNQRLACLLYGVTKDGQDLLPITRWVAVDRSGANQVMLSNRPNEYTRGYVLGGGSIVDWLPDEDGAVLMSRNYSVDTHAGSMFGSAQAGLGVDWLDTRTLRSKQVESPGEYAQEYIADGRGVVRVMATEIRTGNTQQDTGIIHYQYRKQGSRDWLRLSEYNTRDLSGFEPRAVDHDLNVAYGFRRKDGRVALYSLSLDGALTEKLVYARPDVDLDDLVQVGRRNRVVGVAYVTDVRSAKFFDPEIEKITESLLQALPQQPQLSIVDSSVDERKLLIYAGSDDQPGAYYLFDRDLKQLRLVLSARVELNGVALAKMRAVKYPAADGELIPGYLTLPVGGKDPKGLPAIVLPHGGPSARDEWGFDWLVQYFAARGYAVLQPNFRGSAGYGERWLRENGFKSWRTAIGDVLAAGRWLVSQGIADPGKLCVFGWSYGGYAALQSAVAEPALFKAVVAVAPVTDLELLKEEWRGWTNFNLESDFIGSGPHIKEGSPARNADKIKVPVLMFHGALDRNVSIAQSRLMAARLAAVGVRNELVTWDNLDHQLEDSAARAEMLRKSDSFLRAAIGLAP